MVFKLSLATLSLKRGKDFVCHELFQLLKCIPGFEYELMWKYVKRISFLSVSSSFTRAH